MRSIRLLVLIGASICLLANGTAALGAAAASITDEDVASLVTKSVHIVVADVESLRIQGANREYNLKVIETLKGAPTQNLLVRLPLHPDLKAADEIQSFNDPFDSAVERAWHWSPQFWLHRTSPYLRLINGTVDRDVHKGGFLIFVDQPNHVNGWERIFERDDPWYLTVKAVINNSSARGRAMSAIDFLKMFPAVYVTQCGHPEGEGFATGRIWGADVALPDDPKPDYPSPGPCEQHRFESFFYLSLFFDVNDMFPISVPVKNGTIRFAARYGDIVIKDRDLPLAAAISTLTTSRR
jgi:hypothetical protein